MIRVKVNPGVTPLGFSNLYLQTQTSRKTYQIHSEINVSNYSTVDMGKSHQFSGFTPK